LAPNFAKSNTAIGYEINIHLGIRGP
jgi:hypothetical protein